MIYILNAAVMTNYGVFKYTPTTLERVQDVLLSLDYVNAIGHESTAKLFSQITGYAIAPDRLQVKMRRGDCAIVFWANRRLPEGYVVQTIEELQEIGFTFGWLEMIAEVS